MVGFPRQRSHRNLAVVIGLLVAWSTSGQPKGDVTIDDLREAAEPLYARLRGFHQGAGPCLRYANSRLEPAAAERLAERLVNGEVEWEILRKTVMYFHKLNREREAVAHSKYTQADECRKALKASLSVEERSQAERDPAAFEKAVASLSYDRIDAAAEAEAQKFFEALKPHQRNLLLAIWKDDRLALDIGGFSEMKTALETVMARRGLLKVAKFVSHFYQTEHTYPSTLPSHLFGLAEMNPTEGGVVVSGHIPMKDWLFVRGQNVEPYVASCTPRSKVKLQAGEYDAWASSGASGHVIPQFEAVTRKLVGFKVFDLVVGGFLERVGLCNGDIVRRVGDVALVSPEAAMQAHEKYKRASQVTIEVLRGDTAVKIELAQ